MQITIKKRIFFNSAILIVTVILLLVLTLSWFFENTATKINEMETFVQITDFEIYVSRDENDDGLPDKVDENGELDMENGEIVYDLMVADKIEFRYIYPGYTVAFKVVIKSGGSQKLGAQLAGVTAPEFQPLTSGGGESSGSVSSEDSESSGSVSSEDTESEPEELDLAKEMMVEYFLPGQTGPTPNVASLHSLFALGTRDAELFSNFQPSSSDEITFYFSIYMNPNATLKYKDRGIAMSANFFVEN